MTIKIGDTASRVRTISGQDIDLFAQACGDTNPIHLDDDYAATTPFGRRIAHGMLTASLVSAVLANELPGAGTVYLGQDLKFKAPVYIGDTITATVECIAYREDKRIATFKTTCTNQDAKVVLEGEAVVLAPKAE